MKMGVDTIKANLAIAPRFWSGADFIELTKPRVTTLVVLTTLVGYVLGTRGTADWARLLQTLVGTCLVAAGAAAMNQFLERDFDARMIRTENRPLAAGRLHPTSGLLFALALAVLGTLYLLVHVNVLSSFLAAITFASYIFLYTPLKRRTTLCTAIGAVSGALPPVIGWTAAGNPLDGPAWILFGILFFWQFPHFLSIAWMYREDYARAGFKMLPVIDPEGKRVTRQIVAFNLILIPLSALTTWTGLTGTVYLVVALTLGIFYLRSGAALALQPTTANARRLLLASVLYLPALMLAMVLDKQ